MDQDAQVDGDAVVASVPASPEPSSRAAKMATARAGMAAIDAGQPVAVEAKTAAPVVDDTPPETLDPKAAKGIEAIEKRDQRARAALAADQAKWKTERDIEIAELAKMRSEFKAPNFDELKKLPPAKRAAEAMRMVGLDPDDEDVAEVIARDVYARSKSGKADPKNKAYAGQVAEKQELASELADLKRQIAEVSGEFKTRDQRSQMEQFQNQFLDQAVKAVPVELSFIGLALTANPAKARSALLAIGQRLESETGDTPSHAEVIAEYESSRRAELADAGLSEAQIAALISKPVTAPVKTQPPKTLDVTARGTTPTINGNPTRDQKIAAAANGLKKLNAEA